MVLQLMLFRPYPHLLHDHHVLFAVLPEKKGVFPVTTSALLDIETPKGEEGRGAGVSGHHAWCIIIALTLTEKLDVRRILNVG